MRQWEQTHCTMRLLTPGLIARFAEIGPQDGRADPIVVCLIRHGHSGDELYVFDYDPEQFEIIAFCKRGLVNQDQPEMLGGFDLSGFESDINTVTHDYHVHRDHTFKECRFHKALGIDHTVVYWRMGRLMVWGRIPMSIVRDVKKT